MLRTRAHVRVCDENWNPSTYNCLRKRLFAGCHPANKKLFAGCQSSADLVRTC